MLLATGVSRRERKATRNRVVIPPFDERALVNQREVIHVKTITYLLEMWAFIVIQRDNAVKSSGWSLLDKQVFIAE